MLALQGVLVFLFPADVGFVNLDDAHEFAKVWIGEASANAMMMEAAPASPLEMGEAEFAFQLLVVALDAPAQFGRVDENVDGRVFGQGRKPVFGRLFFALGPFDEKPFQRMGRRNLPVPRSRPNPHGREARRQDFVRALPPWNDAPSLLG